MAIRSRALQGRPELGRIVRVSTLGLLVAVSSVGAAATFVVDTTESAPDATPGDGVCATGLPGTPCTLRAAVEESNVFPGADAISLPAGTYTLVDEVLDISDDVTITGAGPTSTVVRGRFTADAVYSTSLIYNKATTSISGMTLSVMVRNATRSASVVHNLEATLDLDHVNVVGNLRGTDGSMNFITNSEGDLTVTDANVGGTARSSESCDAIATESDAGFSATMTLRNVSLSGRLHLYGTNPSSAEMVYSAAGSNGATTTVAMTNVTISGTILPRALGHLILQQRQDPADSAVMTLTNVTLARRVNVGLGNDGDGTMTVQNSIVDAGCAPEFTYQSLGHNIDRGTGCGFSAPGDQSDARAGLRGLRADGGFVKTQALRPGSPAIDAGDDAACPSTDARGAPRPADGDGNGTATCDIGAYEVQP